MPKAKRRPSAAGQETKRRIIDATLVTLRTAGIVGTSARAIAAEGDFNQTLIFYHFGSVDDLVAEAVGQLSQQRMDRYSERLEAVESLPDLVAAARSIFDDDQGTRDIRVLVQAFAGARGDAELGAAMWAHLEPWIDLTAGAIRRALAGTPYGETLPDRRMAYAMSGLFVGLELLTDLDPNNEGDQVFDSMAALAQLAAVAGVLGTGDGSPS